MMKDLAQQEPLDSSFKGDVSKIDIKTSPKPVLVCRSRNS